MNLNEIETLLNDFHTFTNDKWEHKFIKKIYGQKFGLFDRNNFLIETIDKLSLLPKEGWHEFYDNEFQNIKEIKIGNISQT
jgi:hypothetical protein